MQKLKAAWKAKGKDDDHCFCVDDGEKEKDWMSDVPAIDYSALIQSKGARNSVLQT